MKIRLMSDLHTEFRLPYKTQPFAEYRGEDVLVLAGDIGSGSKNVIEVIEFFKSLGFPNIVYVPGNHDYYGNSTYEFNQKMQDKCAKLDGVHFLNPGQAVIDNVIFIGGTLWTNFREDEMAEKAASKMISDFRYIRGFSPEMPRFSTADAKALYYKHVDFIKWAYENRNGKKVVVVSHFLPATQCISPRFANPADLLNYYFANKLESWIEEMQDTVWMFGHTHDPVDTVVGNTRLVANPHGYWTAVDEGQNFEPFKTIEV